MNVKHFLKRLLRGYKDSILYTSVAYIERVKFEAAGLRQSYLGWEPTPYPQLFGEFVPNLSAIDLLFNCGPESRAVIEGKPVE